MTDLHSDNGDPNSYQFIFVLTNKSTGELVCWAQIRLNVTDSYDMFLAEQH